MTPAEEYEWTADGLLVELERFSREELGMKDFKSAHTAYLKGELEEKYVEVMRFKMLLHLSGIE